MQLLCTGEFPPTGTPPPLPQLLTPLISDIITIPKWWLRYLYSFQFHIANLAINFDILFVTRSKLLYFSFKFSW